MRSKWSRVPFFILTLLFTVLLFVQTTRGSGVVTTCTEASLRSAMAGGGLVTFDCAGTILLTQSLVVTQSTTLDASGRAMILDGSNAVRVFEVAAGVHLSLRHVRIYNGRAAGTAGAQDQNGFPGEGGGILNRGGMITLIDCHFSNNLAVGGQGGNPITQERVGGPGRGGAVCTIGGELVATNCFFGWNEARGGFGKNASVPYPRGGDGFGGAVYLTNGALQLHACIFSNNTAHGAGALEIPSFLTPGASGNGFGGAAYLEAVTSTVRDCHFENNLADSTPGGGRNASSGSAVGGAITHLSGNMEVTRTRFSFNRALGGKSVRVGIPGNGLGGAIYNNSLVQVVDCSFLNNSSSGGWGGLEGGDGQGGAFWNGGETTVLTSIFGNNRTQGGNSHSIDDFGLPNTSFISGSADGGAIFNSNKLVLARSALAHNIAEGPPPFERPGRYTVVGGFGGGVLNSGTCFGTNNIFFGNLALGGPLGPRIGSYSHGFTPANGYGGGLFNQTGLTYLVHQTLDHNGAIAFERTNGIGVGGAINSAGGTVTLVNTIVANSVSGSNCFGTIIDAGHNISSDNSCPFAGPGSAISTDPKLGPYEDFGGPTPTVPLLAGSPAIDNADPGFCPLTDQRGRSRPAGAGCDIGAFESSEPYAIHGLVSGYSSAGTVIGLGTSNVTVDAKGHYAIPAHAGVYTVTAVHTNLVLDPHHRTVTVAADVVEVDFTSYRSNHLASIRSNGLVNFVYAGADSRSIQIQVSTNLAQWDEFLTNQTSSNGVFRFDQSLADPTPSRMFRVLLP